MYNSIVTGTVQWRIHGGTRGRVTGIAEIQLNNLGDRGPVSPENSNLDLRATSQKEGGEKERKGKKEKGLKGRDVEMCGDHLTGCAKKPLNHGFTNGLF